MIPPEAYAHWLALQDDQGALIIPLKKQPRCGGCGRWMREDDAHLAAHSLGICHLDSKCIERFVGKIRAVNPAFNWRFGEEVS
jgi:hypothetical protein